MSERYLIRVGRWHRTGEIYLVQSESKSTFTAISRWAGRGFSGRGFRIPKADVVAVLDDLQEADRRIATAAEIDRRRDDETKPLREQISQIAERANEEIAAALRGGK